MDKMLMQGKVAMVTGGGRGIGEASARRLADFGAKVILADLDLASATAVAESLKAEGKEARQPSSSTSPTSTTSPRKSPRRARSMAASTCS